MPVLSPNSADVLLWDSSHNFGSSRVWHSLRVRQAKVDWYKLVWFNGHIPMYSFIVWMLCRGRLQTKDRLSKWNIISDSKCVFCDACETVEHLFFLCPFSATMSRKLSSFCKDFHEPRGWSNELQRMVNHGHGNYFSSKLMKVVFGCAIYLIWRESNDWIFNNKTKKVDSLILYIVNLVKSRVCRWRRIPKSKGNWLISVEWGFPRCIFDR
ncbi:hypothetical protein LIER_27936 [Lithospermum erythrorhizon]|uniref:Reverse transcriptase zinc-binding domain-containing protein n=1 Tax=Lithospermum erythrorhizon TaxID=34254 RepID=A0AAV3RH94_LITER